MDEQASFLKPLREFCRAARGGSQEQIIVEFLQLVVRGHDLIDAGSVLITDEQNAQLVLFNEDEFLFQRKLLPVDDGQRLLWPSKLGWYEGAAGKALRTKESVTYQKASAKPGDFTGDSPIENMICIPIMTGGSKPFGVVCLHNNIPDKVFSKNTVQLMEAYVDALAMALHTPHPELNIEKNVFIVHGRDEVSRLQLEKILAGVGAKPKVLAEKRKNASLILTALEDLLRTCKAGFILYTPDDEGRLRGDDSLNARARENVVFETGLLFARFRAFDRVCILKKRPAEFPSDLYGVAYESFDKIPDIESKIVERLRDWGVTTPVG